MVCISFADTKYTPKEMMEFWKEICKRLIWKYFEIQIFLHTLWRIMVSNFTVKPDRDSSWSSQSRDIWITMFSSAFCTDFDRCYLACAGWLLSPTPPTRLSISSFPYPQQNTKIKLLLSLCSYVIFLLTFCLIYFKS